MTTRADPGIGDGPGRPSAPDVLIRWCAPRWRRVYSAAFLVVFAGLLIAQVIRSPRGWLAITAVLAVGIAIPLTHLRLSVTATTDRLVVRNRFTTTTFTNGESTGFRAGRAPFQRRQAALAFCVYALSTSHRPTPLTAITRRGFRTPSDELEREVEVLRRWLHDGAPRHSPDAE